MSKALDNKVKLNDVVSVKDFGAKGDGVTNDGVAIIAALETGKHIILPQGTYLINGYILTPVSGQHIYGPGRLLNTSDVVPVQMIKVLNVNDVVIDGVWFDCTGNAARCYGVTIESATRTTVRNCKSTVSTFCFVWKNSNGTRVLNNTVNGGQFGIATGGDAAGNTDGVVSDTLIQGNYITGCTSEGIDLNWDTQDCVVNANTLVANNSVSFEEEIDIGGGVCSDIIISNNSIDGGGNSASGITIKKNPTTPTTNVTVVGNSIRNLKTSDSAGRGIRFTNSVNGVIAGNLISDAYAGIFIDTDVSDVVVSDNNIDAIQSRGVVVSVGANTNVRIVNNIIKNTGQLTTLSNNNRAGVYVENASGIAINNNTLYNCGATAPTGAGAYGFGISLASTASRVTVADNEVTGSGNTGINAATNYVSFQNNTVYLNGSAGISTTGDYCSVTGNMVYDNAVVVDTSYGVSVGTGADYNVISNNTVFDTRGASARQNGLRFVGAADRVICSSNIAYNNKTTNFTGSGSLTNSVVVNNITS